MTTPDSKSNFYLSSDDITAGIIITPISKHFKPNIILNGELIRGPDSKRDYNEQLERVERGEHMCWDDSNSNQSCVGDFFGFRFHDDRVEVHKITDVHDPSHRLPSWSENVGQTKRNVLMLSPRVCIIPWSEWVKIGWHASGSLKGTQRMMNIKSQLQFLRCINRQHQEQHQEQPQKQHQEQHH